MTVKLCLPPSPAAETWISAAEDSGSYNSQICRHALIVFDISIAIVIGPTPPGTGVIAPATFETL